MAPERSARCLVVDDNPLVRWSVVRFLETCCLEARSVESGELALALMREWPVDLLITDASLPGMEQGAFVRRCQGLCPRPRIILLTAGEGQLPPADLEGLGVIGMIEKPLVTDRLGQLLAGLLQRADETAA